MGTQLLPAEADDRLRVVESAAIFLARGFLWAESWSRTCPARYENRKEGEQDTTQPIAVSLKVSFHLSGSQVLEEVQALRVALRVRHDVRLQDVRPERTHECNARLSGPILDHARCEEVRFILLRVKLPPRPSAST